MLFGYWYGTPVVILDRANLLALDLAILSPNAVFFLLCLVQPTVSPRYHALFTSSLLWTYSIYVNKY